MGEWGCGDVGMSMRRIVCGLWVGSKLYELRSTAECFYVRSLLLLVASYLTMFG